MRRTVWFFLLVIGLIAQQTASIWADTTINGNSMALLSYASAISQGNSTFGSNSGSTAQFTTDGFAGTYIYLPTDGAVTFTANASGVASGGIDPNMTMSIADYKQSFTVNAANGSTYSFTTPTLKAGYYAVRTQLDNQAGTVKPQLNLSSFTVSSNATVMNSNTDANALNAANTYIQNYRQGAATVPTGFSSGQSLQVKLVRNAFNFGSYVPGFNQSDVTGFLNTSSVFGSFLKDNFNSVVPANAGKWSYNETKSGSSTQLASGDVFTVTMGGPDAVMAYAKSHHMSGRMHTLLWSYNQQTPGWINTEVSAAGSGNPTANLMNAISDRIGYYIGGGDNPAQWGTGWIASLGSPYPKNQLNTITNDVRATDFSQVDVLNEPFHRQPSFYNKLGNANTAYVYYQAKQAAAAAGANTIMYANEYNVMQNSSLTITPTGTSAGSDPYANWYQQYINTLNNQTYNVPNVGNIALGQVVNGVAVQWYPTAQGPTPSAATMSQALHNLSVLGLPISIGEAGIQSSISTTNGTATSDASNVKVLDDTVRILYGTPNVDTFTLWGWWASQTDAMDQSSVLVNANGTLTAAGTRYKYLMGTGVDPKAVFYSFDQANADGSNSHPFNTPTQNVTVNPDGSVNFNGVYGQYELDGTLNGNSFRFATVDFEKGLNGTATETLWVKGDYNLDGKVTNADFQTMLAALTNQNRVVSGALVLGYQASNNMSNDEFLAICDINDDGSFDAKDIAVMQQLLASGVQAGNGFFGGGGSLASVPEPTSAVLAAISLGLLVIQARRSRRA